MHHWPDIWTRLLGCEDSFWGWPKTILSFASLGKVAHTSVVIIVNYSFGCECPRRSQNIFLVQQNHTGSSWPSQQTEVWQRLYSIFWANAQRLSLLTRQGGQATESELQIDGSHSCEQQICQKNNCIFAEESWWWRPELLEMRAALKVRGRFALVWLYPTLQDLYQPSQRMGFMSHVSSIPSQCSPTSPTISGCVWQWIWLWRRWLWHCWYVWLVVWLLLSSLLHSFFGYEGPASTIQSLQTTLDFGSHIANRISFNSNILAPNINTAAAAFHEQLTAATTSQTVTPLPLSWDICLLVMSPFPLYKAKFNIQAIKQQSGPVLFVISPSNL